MYPDYDDEYPEPYEDDLEEHERRELDRDREFDMDDNGDNDDLDFADPGGESALRAGVREFPCPSCHASNALTERDVSLGYQCDACAVACERGYDRDYVCAGAEGGCPICRKNEEE